MTVLCLFFSIFNFEFYNVKIVMGAKFEKIEYLQIVINSIHHCYHVKVTKPTPLLPYFTPTISTICNSSFTRYSYLFLAVGVRVPHSSTIFSYIADTFLPQFCYLLHGADCSMSHMSTLRTAPICIVSLVSAKEAMSEALSCRQPGGCQVSWLETQRPTIYFTILGI